MTPESKFVDLGADSLDTVSPFQHWEPFMFILSLSGDPLQVEIMMALEEKFDLQLDEEGESMGCCSIPQYDPSYDFSSL